MCTKSIKGRDKVLHKTIVTDSFLNFKIQFLITKILKVSSNGLEFLMM